MPLRPARLTCAALAAAFGLAACGPGDIDRDATARADAEADAEAMAATASPAADAPRVEPTEAEMRAFAEAEVDAINAKGGLVISMSGVTSDPIKVRLTSFRKIGCTPYTRAFRCEAEMGWAYPGSELPDEVLPSSRRYTPDGKGGWSID